MSVLSIDLAHARRLVVAHQGALGDFLLVLSALEGLWLGNSGILLDFISKKEHVALLADKPYVGNVYCSDGPELIPFFHEDLWQAASIPACMRDVGAVLVFGQAGSRMVAERLARRLSCPVHWIQSFPDESRVEPVADFVREQLRGCGWQVEQTIARIEPPAHEASFVAEWLERAGLGAGCRPVLAHPGSGGRRKIWPLRRWWSLVELLIEERRLPVVLTLGPADECLVDFAKGVRELGVHVLSGLSLPALSSFLASSRLYVGNDSGVSHLAAAVGAESVVIFGPTNPHVWAPVGPGVQVVRASWDERDSLDWSFAAPRSFLEEEVRAAVERALA